MTACGGSGGGVTTEAPPTPSPVPPAPVFPYSESLSSLMLYQGSTLQIAAVPENTYRLVFFAKNTNNQPMTGLNIRLGLESISEQAATEVEPGVYQLTMSFSQGEYQAFAKKDNVLTSHNLIIVSSYCNAPLDPSAAPFHRIITKSSKQFRVVCDPVQFAEIKNQSMSLNYLLGNLIDLGAFYTDANSDSIADNQFKIGTTLNPYVGHFDGAGFLISGFSYKAPSEDDVGLFAALGTGSIVENVSFTNASVQGAYNVGVLAGQLTNLSSNQSRIQNVIVVSPSIKGTQNLGGLVGLISSNGNTNLLNVSSSLSLDLSSENQNMSHIGGIVGFNTGANITSAFSTFELIGTNNLFTVSVVGGLVGEDFGVNSKISQSSATVTLSYDKAMNMGCLVGKATNSEVEDLTQNILCSVNQGNASITFSGGLFGTIKSSIISNVYGSVNSTVYGPLYGSLAASISDSTVSGVNLSGEINSINSSQVSSIGGEILNSQISNVISFSNLSGALDNVGAIAAYSNNSLYSKIGNYGSISAAEDVVGGLIGEMVGGNISDAFNQGTVSGRDSVGGLVGIISGTSIIDRVFSSGSIIATGNEIGGLIGKVTGSVNLSNSFSLSEIQNTSQSEIGAIIGAQNGTKMLNSNYYLSSRVGVIDVCGNDSCVATDTVSSGGVSYYMSNTNPPMTTWDFNSIWIFTPGLFPYFL